mmetsp:Transcript_13956/g.38142  ORF Transcript_13956/g.38142 Transcript_13956/m.38142 type:complete len:291 (+) Transcript_13956:1052-1924(+)
MLAANVSGRAVLPQDAVETAAVGEHNEATMSGRAALPNDAVENVAVGERDGTTASGRAALPDDADENVALGEWDEGKASGRAVLPNDAVESTAMCERHEVVNKSAALAPESASGLQDRSAGVHVPPEASAVCGAPRSHASTSDARASLDDRASMGTASRPAQTASEASASNSATGSRGAVKPSMALLLGSWLDSGAKANGPFGLTTPSDPNGDLMHGLPKPSEPSGDLAPVPSKSSKARACCGCEPTALSAAAGGAPPDSRQESWHRVEDALEPPKSAASSRTPDGAADG